MWQCNYLINKASVMSWTEDIKLFSCSTELSMKFSLLIIVKMPTVVGTLTYMSRKMALKAYLSLKKLTVLIFLYL